MIVLKPLVESDGRVTPRWAMVDDVIRRELNSHPDLRYMWTDGGYDKLAEIAHDYFGMTAMYRDERDCVTFEFTEHQWTMFTLKWLS